jgi:predicted SnoaL-like aldol condensation-catalyzing enzyme
MIAKNVNTNAHGDVHLVVLAHLRRRWSLSGRDEFSTFDAFREVETLFSERSDAVVSRPNASRVRSVHPVCRGRARTGASSRSRDRHIRSV